MPPKRSCSNCFSRIDRTMNSSSPLGKSLGRVSIDRHFKALGRHEMTGTRRRTELHQPSRHNIPVRLVNEGGMPPVLAAIVAIGSAVLPSSMRVFPSCVQIKSGLAFF